LEYALERARAARVVAPEIGLPEVRRLFRVFKENVRAMHAYAPQAGPGRAVLFRSSEPALGGVRQDPFMGWGALLGGGVEVYTVPGDHYTMMLEPDVRVLAEQLVARIDRSKRVQL
jgi:thioesterase domain-containing protein